MFSALFLVLRAWILISKGQGTDQESRNYEDIYVPKGTSYLLNITTNISVANTSCPTYEIYGLIMMNSGEENVSASRRLASIPSQELKVTQDSTFGTIVNYTKQDFKLGDVSFLSTVNKRNNSHDEFELHLKLGIVIPESSTSHPLFNEIKLVVRCQKRNDPTSLATRHEAGLYRLVYYNETSERSTLNSTGITQASQSLGLLVTSSPDPGSSEEKKNPPGERPTLDSTGITQASQSLRLPAVTSSPGSSEEKTNPLDTKSTTEESLVWCFVLAAVFSIVRLICMLMLSIYRRSRL